MRDQEEDRDDRYRDEDDYEDDRPRKKKSRRGGPSASPRTTTAPSSRTPTRASRTTRITSSLRRGDRLDHLRVHDPDRGQRADQRRRAGGHHAGLGLRRGRRRLPRRRVLQGRPLRLFLRLERHRRRAGHDHRGDVHRLQPHLHLRRPSRASPSSPASGSRRNVTDEVFTFREATELRTSQTRRYTNGVYQGTDYTYTWTDVTGRKRYTVSGHAQQRGGQPRADGPVPLRLARRNWRGVTRCWPTASGR